MARPPKGEVVEYQRKDGLITYSLRVTADGERPRVRLGTQDDGWTRPRADAELARVLARIEAGVWMPPVKEEEKKAAPPGDQTFHEFATACLHARKGEIDDSTYADYEWRLCCHLLPFFAEYLLSEIDVELVDAYRTHKVTEREHIKDMIKADTPLRDERGWRIRPLGNESINKTLAYLAAILDIAIDRKLITSNPARGRRRRLKVVRPRRPFLESDEVKSMLTAAEELDREQSQPSARARLVKGLRDEDGLSYIEIEKLHGIPRGSAHYLYRRASAERVPILLRRVVIAVLIGAGLRVSELCALTWRDVNLEKGRLDIKDAKTEAGVREVRLSRWVVKELRVYRDSLTTWAPDDPVFPTGRGKARDRKDVCERIVKKAARRADELRTAAELPPLPAGVTPHALRCTYISLAFEAGYPLPYVMAQVGHTDESTTLQIYARVMKRKARDVQDAAFDELVEGRVLLAA